MDKQGYKKLSILGYGAFAKVYLVKKEEQKYAMKEIENIESFFNKAMIEINILKHCHHINIPYYNNHHIFTKYIYVILEHCNGLDLWELLQKQYHHCFSISQTLHYVKQILEGLIYLHSQGIIHRDLKLENILTTKSNIIKIIDYNLSTFDVNAIKTISFIKPYSKEHGVVTRSNKILTGVYGTPEYLAPEILNSLPYTDMVDWWAFGIMIYELIYGQTPFTCVSYEQMLNKIKLGYFELLPMTLAGEEVNDITKDIIIKLLNQQNDKRLGFIGGGEEIKDHFFFNTHNLF